MAWFHNLWTEILAWLRSWRFHGARRKLRESKRRPPAPPPYKVVRLAEDPDQLHPRTLYAIGENGNLWHAVLTCPCGCGAVIALNMLPDDSPRWRLDEQCDGPTLFPSVWRTTGCRSHFILRGGQIIWCHGQAPEDEMPGRHPVHQRRRHLSR